MMRYSRVISLLTLLSFLISSQTLSANTVKNKSALPASSQAKKIEALPPTIAFFNPSDPQNTFWPPIFDLIEKAGRDVGFKFIHYDLGVQDRQATEIKIKEVLEKQATPNAIMASTTINAAKRILIANRSLSSPIIFEGPLFPAELKHFDKLDREEKSNWIGYFEQNEEEKGFVLGKILIEKAREKKAFAKDGKIHVLGLGGTRHWYGSKLRELGLKRAVDASPDVVLNQIVPANWSSKKAKTLSLLMLTRFPESTVIWAASDQMAEGAAEALKERGKKLGENAFVGGTDLSEVGVSQVIKGNFVATVGSPRSFYVKVAIYLYDTVKKAIPLSREIRLTSEVHAATEDTVHQYKHLNAIEDAIHYRDFSLAHHRELKGHDFSWPALLIAACKTQGIKLGRSGAAISKDSEKALKTCLEALD